jgi:mono/diheme cytochrome c family protein
MRWIRFAWGLGLAAAVSLAVHDTQAAEATPDGPDAAGLAVFQQHLRELFAHRCVMCHGGDSTEGDFDLTTREGLLKGGALGEVLTVGQGSASRLVKLLRHEEEPHMPEEGDKLTDEEVAWVVEWIDRGAPYDRPLRDAEDATPWTERVVPAEARDFWSFRRFQPIETPALAEGETLANPIDAFVRAKQREEGITPNPEADRRTLVRRAYLDLLGLPPSPAEVDAFLADQSPDAYDRLVDRLLENPHFGERWARHWLDVARFAESHGFEHDYDRPTAYHYRDFVIRAFNDDLPYDTFIRWQLAGDEFAPENPLAMMATGFLAAGVHATQITKNEVEKQRYDELDDIVGTTTTSMLGLTLGCARCHDHKYDPLPQRDYYQMVSVFTTTVRSEQELNLDPAAYQAARDKYDAELAPLVSTITAYENKELPGRFAEWEKTSAAQAAVEAWKPLEAKELSSTSGATFRALDDRSYLVEGANADHDTYVIRGTGDLAAVTALRIEVIPHDSLPQQGPGRAPNGNFALTDVALSITQPDGTSIDAPLERAVATFEQSGLPAAATIDDDAQSAWAIDGRIGAPSSLVLQVAEGAIPAGDAPWTLTLKFENNAAHSLGRFRLSTATAPRPVGLEGAGLTEAIASLLRIPAEKRTPDERQLLLDWFKWRDTGWQALRAPVRALQLAEPRPTLTKALISSEGVPAVRLHTQGGDFLDHTHFLKRGNSDDKVAVAEPGYLQVLCDAGEGPEHWFVAPPEGSRTSYRRRALAEWMTDVDHGGGHLLARVIVNRLWHYHFGRGIVATPSDFGTRGEPPTHPELLDWLAQELIRGGWRLKPIHRLILTSQAYKQSSTADPAKLEHDHENKLVWRFTPRRLEAEIIRDAMLSTSGALDATMFGPGTLDESHRRRSIYFTVKRSKLVPMMLSFDAPDALAGLGRRATTTVAPQALTIMNNPQVRAWATTFATQLAPNDDTPLDHAIQNAYLRALCRAPDEQEAQSARVFIEAQTTAYTQSGAPTPRTTALADFCQVLFGLNEFAYLE